MRDLPKVVVMKLLLNSLHCPVTRANLSLPSDNVNLDQTISGS